MINITKSQPEPACLVAERKKKSGDYKCGEVLMRLQTDFHNKCYICENQGIIAINVEHFIPHRGDRTLMFEWNNLFFACAHCNNIKSDKYDDILNCTNLNDKIQDLIEFKVISFPKEAVTIKALRNDKQIESTVELLEKVYNGHTNLKRLASANLRAKILEEINDFEDLLTEFKNPSFPNQKYQAAISRKIQKKLKTNSPFTAFKIWIIKEDETLYNHFKFDQR